MMNFSKHITRLVFPVIVIVMLSACAVSRGNNKPASTPSANAKTSARDGSSFEKALFIKAKDEMSGIQAEHTWLSKHYPGYKMKLQSLLFNGNKAYDLLEVVTRDGKEHKIYFDITSFYGKM